MFVHGTSQVAVSDHGKLEVELLEKMPRLGIHTEQHARHMLTLGTGLGWD